MKYVNILLGLVLIGFVAKPTHAQVRMPFEYYEEAAKNNPELRALHNDYLATLQKVPQVGALPDPEVSFAWFISPIETRVGPQTARISGMQMFPWFGTLGQKQDAVTELARAKYELVKDLRNQLYHQVDKAWYKLYELQGAIRITEENIVILKTFESLAVTKSEQGEGSLVDVIRIQLEIAELENQVLYLEDRRAPLIADFNRVLNREATTDLLVPDSLNPAVFELRKDEVLDSIRQTNYKLQSIKNRQESVLHSKEIAKRDGLPSFGVGLNYFLTSPRKELDFPGNGKDALAPMVSVRVPLQRKKYDAKVLETDIQLRALQFTEDDIENKLTTQLEDAWAEFTDAKRRRALYNSQKVKAQQAVEILLNTYVTGGKDFEEILRLQRMLLKYELELIRADKDEYIHVSRMKSLLGTTGNE